MIARLYTWTELLNSIRYTLQGNNYMYMYTIIVVIVHIHAIYTHMSVM